MSSPVSPPQNSHRDIFPEDVLFYEILSFLPPHEVPSLMSRIFQVCILNPSKTAPLSTSLFSIKAKFTRKFRDDYKKDLITLFPRHSNHRGPKRMAEERERRLLQTAEISLENFSLHLIKNELFRRLRALPRAKIPSSTLPLKMLKNEWINLSKIDAKCRRVNRIKTPYKKRKLLKEIILDCLREELFELASEEIQRFPSQYKETLFSVLRTYVTQPNFHCDQVIQIAQQLPNPRASIIKILRVYIKLPSFSPAQAAQMIHYISVPPLDPYYDRLFDALFKTYFKQENCLPEYAFQIAQQQSFCLKPCAMRSLVKAYLAVPNFDFEWAIQFAQQSDKDNHDFEQESLCKTVTAYLQRSDCDLEQALQITTEKIPEGFLPAVDQWPASSIRGPILYEIVKTHLARPNFNLYLVSGIARWIPEESTRLRAFDELKKAFIFRPLKRLKI